MNYLRSIAFGIVGLGLSTAVAAAATGDLPDTRDLVAQSPDGADRCGALSPSASLLQGCCGTPARIEPGSPQTDSVVSPCVGGRSQTSSTMTSAQSLSSTPPSGFTVSPPQGGSVSGGGGGGSSAAQASLLASTGTGPRSGEGSAGSSSVFDFGGGGGGGAGGRNLGAPGPIAGAGLPFLLIAGGYALWRKYGLRT
ncbi:hypothetical protein [Methylobacterium sp. J-076]|uniref:hypothetical protein n=1 Tax=Methylobacterium sp. J-076 TaxID=2836655 RepID=UPI001FB8E103|nr:hypothetical protein [Methylobacterium sp. J-076]MCJ2011416.1 hypothetical protein [Methylobacterium sp. J-076]